jgi:branched-chain amino acid transport system permease protein
VSRRSTSSRAGHTLGWHSAKFWSYACALLLLTLYFVHRFRRSRVGQAALMTQMYPRLAAMCGSDADRRHHRRPPHPVRPLMGTAFLLSQKSFAPLDARGDKLVFRTALVTVLRLEPQAEGGGLASGSRARSPRSPTAVAPERGQAHEPIAP